MPYIINSVAVAFMFKFFLHNQYGGLNIILRSINLNKLALDWIGDPKLVNFTLAFIALWKYMGYMMVVFLGGLQSISFDIYESASIDGATGWQSFRHITLPGIKHILKLNLFLNLNGALGMFEMPFAMFNGMGSPMGVADTFAVKTVLTAFTYQDYGLASALGVVMMAAIALLVFLQNKVFFRETD